MKVKSKTPEDLKKRSDLRSSMHRLHQGIYWRNWTQSEDKAERTQVCSEEKRHSGACPEEWTQSRLGGCKGQSHGGSHSKEEGVGSNSHPRERMHQQPGRGTNPEPNLETFPQNTTPSSIIRTHNLPIMLNSSFSKLFQYSIIIIASNYP